MIPGATPTKGRLLVATPLLTDDNFHRSVIYMLEHHGEGAVGVVLNRPSGLPLHEPIDRWSDWEPNPTGLFTGGPVEPSALIALGLTTKPLTEGNEHASPVAGRVVSADLTADPTLSPIKIEAVRVFRGYAGWGGGQLEAEIDSGSWMLLDAQERDLFGDQPGDLWRDVLRRQPGRLAWLADIPDDLSAN